MTKAILRIALLACIAVTGSLHGQWKSSGLEDLDRLRKEVAATPTTAETFIPRRAMLFSWQSLLGNGGVDLSAYAGIPRTVRGPSDEQRWKAMDNAWARLESIQNNPTYIETITAPAVPYDGTPREWPLFHGDGAQTGYSSDPGPSQGKLAWRFPVGHSWYSQPRVEDGRVYVASPGRTTVLYALDEDTGRTIWKARQHGAGSYGTPRICSSVVVQEDTLVVRESGSMGEPRHAVNLVYVDKASGEVLKRVRAGHVDYRRGYAPVQGDDRYLFYPRGYQWIQNFPPLIWMLNQVVVADAKTGEEKWSLRLGTIFGDIGYDEEAAYVGVHRGIVYALNLDGQERIRWQFDAKGPVSRSLLVTGDSVLVGNDTGAFYSLDKRTGKARWKFQSETTEPRAFQFYSIPIVANGRVYVGAANKQLYCLDARTGKLLWKQGVRDWIRSAPVVSGGNVVAATFDGWMTGIREVNGKPRVEWEKQIAPHHFLADLTAGPKGVLVNSNDLILYSVDPANGETRWEHSLLESVMVDGERIRADAVAGGGDHQSSPTIVDGIVYIGGPDRFVHAVDSETGEEIWRFETSGQVSAAPIFAEGRIYFGQQGGNRDFHAVDAKTGHPIWKQEVGWGWMSPGYNNGKVFLGTVDGDMMAMNAEDGEILWTHETNGGVHPAPATDDKNVYTGTWEGYFFALDQNTGRLEWVFDIGARPDSGAPVLWDDQILINALGEWRRLDGLDAKTGELRWHYKVPDGQAINATPAVHGDRAYFAMLSAVGSEVAAFDRSTSKIVWTTPGGGLTGPAIGRDKVCFGSTSLPYFYCVDAKGNGDGTTDVLWRYRYGDSVDESCPAIYGDKAYILVTDCYLYAFE